MMKEPILPDISCVDFLVSILVRFPQIFAIRYNNTLKSYVFTFMYRGNLPTEGFMKLKEKITDYFGVYRELSSGLDIQLSFKKRKYRKCTFIEVSMEGNGLNVQDINLLASTMAVELGEEIISDYEEYALGYQGEDLEREVEYLSRDGFQSRKKDNLIVFRESGKVYVFDK